MTELMLFDECFGVSVSLEGLLFVHCSYITISMSLLEKLVIMLRDSIAVFGEYRVFAISTRASAAGIARIDEIAALWTISSWRASRNGIEVAIFDGE